MWSYPKPKHYFSFWGCILKQIGARSSPMKSWNPSWAWKTETNCGFDHQAFILKTKMKLCFPFCIVMWFLCFYSTGCAQIALFREVTIWELQVIRKDSNSEPNLHCPQTKPKRSCKMLTQVRLYASFALHFLRCGDFGTFNLGQTENSFHKTLGLGNIGPGSRGCFNGLQSE